MRSIRSLYLVAMATLALVAVSAAAGAAGDSAGYEEFDDFEVFIEINATDLDAGLQGMVDGPAWRNATIRGEDGKPIFRLQPASNLRGHGVTENRWESNEPPFEPSPEAEDGYTLDDFLALFPDGTYEARGKTIDGMKLRSSTELTHDLPAGPDVTSHEEDDEVESGSDLLVTWDEVTTVFAPDDPQGDATDPLEAEITGYIVVLEYTLVVDAGGPDEDEIAGSVTIEVSADTFSVVIPAEALPPVPGPDDELDEFKIEVGAVEESGNLTFTEVPLEIVAA